MFVVVAPTPYGTTCHLGQVCPCSVNVWQTREEAEALISDLNHLYPDVYFDLTVVEHGTDAHLDAFD